VKNKATIAAIKEDNERVIHELYNSSQAKFVNWIKGKYKIAPQEACLEIYQRSFTVLYFNVKKGKLNDLDASIETYLFGIGKMVVREWWREASKYKEDDLNEAMEDLSKIDLFGDALNQKSDKFELTEQLAKGMNEIGEPCKTVLQLFYWEQNSMEAIAIKLNYKNEQVAKKKKYLCLQKLKEIMRD
jgi:RNA polymerase sigma factor (sigma-70 family)